MTTYLEEVIQLPIFPRNQFITPSHEFDSGLGVLIASYTVESESDLFLGLSEEECLNQTLDDLSEIHGEYIRDLYIEGIVKRWSLDPFSHGAWTQFNPYQLSNLWVPLTRPNGNLYFAGEHTSFIHGWIDTAMRSAVEAVNCMSTGRCYPEFAEFNTNMATRCNLNACLLVVPFTLFCISYFNISVDILLFF